MGRTLRRGRIVVPVAVILLTLSAAAYGHSRSDIGRFVGAYTLVDPSGAQERVDDAIHRVVNEMGFFKRGIARTKIHDEIWPEARIQIAVVPGDRVRISMDDWHSPPIMIGGEPVMTIAEDRRPARFSVHVENDALVAVSRTDRGVRTSTFTLAPDGRHMRMAVRITSQKLPVPIAYTLDYGRTH